MGYQQPEVGSEGSLHKVVLPRSWLQVHLENPKQDVLVNMSLSYVLVEPLAELLRRVYSQSRPGLFSSSLVTAFDDT
jgi:hypothetical protein